VARRLWCGKNAFKIKLYLNAEAKEIIASRLNGGIAAKTVSNAPDTGE